MMKPMLQFLDLRQSECSWHLLHIQLQSISNGCEKCLSEWRVRRGGICGTS